MLRKRLIAAVIVREGMAVQSFGFRRWLPLGKVSCIVENLDRWGADGIAVLVTDRNGEGPDIDLIRELCAMGLSTPLTYGGGIMNQRDAEEVIKAGSERIILDRALSQTVANIESISEAIGVQAIVASVPLIKKEGKISHLKHWAKRDISSTVLAEAHKWKPHVSEILAIDVNAEGTVHGPDKSIIEYMAKEFDLPILSFGGISNAQQIHDVLNMPGVSASVIGNALNYQENSIYSLKKSLLDLPIRPQSIATNY